MKFFLRSRIMLNGILLSADNPLDIIKGDNVVDGDGFRLLGMSHFYRIMQKGGIVVAACVLTVTFIGLIWVSKAQEITEKKKNLAYAFVVTFFIASIATVFTVGKNLMDAVFF